MFLRYSQRMKLQKYFKIMGMFNIDKLSNWLGLTMTVVGPPPSLARVAPVPFTGQGSREASR